MYLGDIARWVKIAGDQIIAGVKTFTSSPIAPTPASGDNSTKVATTAFATGQDLGVGQTWQNVTASRALGVTYTNSTGKPITVSIRAFAGVLGTFIIDGLTVINFANNDPTYGNFYSYTVIIPNGSTYSMTGSTIGSWFELR